MSFDLTNKNISDTFQNLLQRTGSDNQLYDLEGNLVYANPAAVEMWGYQTL